MLAIWGICVSVNPTTEKPRGVFGVRISIGANSDITTYVCYINTGRVLTHKKICDENSFIKIVSGYWPSIYNPERINLFELNNVGCNMYEDSVTLQKIPLCIPFDSLWKIRFSVYPFRNRDELGWSNKYHKPSPMQEIYLSERYGVGQIDGDFFLDTNFWRILKDVTDSSWIANYKSLN